jgi:hypothetical protein
MRRYRDLLASCIKYAVSKGFDVAILAHLDNMREYTWRNLLQARAPRARPAACWGCQTRAACPTDNL